MLSEQASVELDLPYFVRVLILVLMEYALRESITLPAGLSGVMGLNPCFNGICSQSAKQREERGWDDTS